MNREQVRQLFKRIQSNYPNFIIDDYKITEWAKELKDYDEVDVHKKLEEHMRNEQYGNQEPKVYFLTKYLKTIKEKNTVIKYNVHCPICGKYVNLEQYEDHYVKCNRTKLMINDMKVYYNKDLNLDEILRLSDVDYERLYIKYLNMILNVDIPSIRKKLILKVLYPEQDLSIDDVVSNIGG